MSILQQNPNEIYIPLQEQQNQPHKQPVLNQPPSNQIITNQMTKVSVLYVDSTNFKTDPLLIICPICKNQVQTVVNKKWDWYSFCLCHIFGLCAWITFQCCRNKQLNCFDAEHFCPRCGNKIVEYSSF